MREEIELYLDYIQAEKDLSANTVQSYKRDLRDLSVYLESRGINQLQEVSAYDLMSFLSLIESKGKSPSTISRMAATIRSFFGYMLDERFINQNPSKKLQTPKLIKRAQAPISQEQIALLIGQPDAQSIWGMRDKVMLELLYATGLKVTELIQLKVEDVNLELSFIRCSGVQKRVIPIGPSVKAMLESYLAQARPQMIKNSDQQPTVLFLNHKGQGLTRQGFWKILKAYADQAGIQQPITPELIRQSFAIHLIQSGADVNKVSDVLGYTSTQSANHLMTNEQNRLKAVYEKVKPRV